MPIFAHNIFFNLTQVIMAKEASYTGGAGNKTFLQVGTSHGRLYRPATESEKAEYLRKKEENENYDGYDIAVKSGTTQSGATFFHKIFFRTEKGYIRDLGVKKVDFKDGKSSTYLTMSVVSTENPGQTDVLNIPLYNQQSGLNRLVKQVITVLPNINPEVEYWISSSRKDNDKGGYSLNVWFNYGDNPDDFQSSKSARPFHTYPSPANSSGDIPVAEKVMKMGVEKLDFTKQDEYLYSILEKQIDRWKDYSTESEQPTPQPAPQAAQSDKEPKSFIPEEDDLPF